MAWAAAIGLGILCQAARADDLTARLQAAEKEQIAVDAAVIPDKTFMLVDFGAVGDDKTFNTDAFAKAVAAIKGAGGGHLVVPAGKFRTKGFVLTSHMDLHLSPGAVIEAPSDLADYGIADPNQPATRPSGGFGRGRAQPFISGSGLTDVSITGPGVIDGSGQMFWIWSDKAARRYPPGRAIVPRPTLVSFSGVNRLHIDGVSFTNAARSHLVTRGQNILIENIRVFSPSDSPNTDAIDPQGQRIVIRNSELDIGDDNVAIQAGSHDVLIEGLTCLHGHGISIGSPTEAGLSHIVVRDCTFDGTDNGLRIKSYRGRGGEVHDVIYTNITMKNVRRPFDINMRYDGNANVTSDVGPRDGGGTEAIPHFHDIHVNNLTVTRSPIAGRIVGIPEQPAADVTFTNCKFDTVLGFYVEDAKDITFQNVQMTAGVGEPFVTKNAAVTLDGKPVSGQGDAEPFYWGD